MQRCYGEMINQEQRERERERERENHVFKGN